MKLTKGYFENDSVYFAVLPVDDDAKRIAWDILRAQEHVTTWENSGGEIDWRRTDMTPEDFYAY